MARTIDQIYQGFLESVEATPELSGATSTSNTAIWKAFYRVAAIGIATFEQLQDAFKKDLEFIRDNSQIYNESWWNDKMKNFFQYAPTEPDKGILKINDNFVISYDVVDDSKKIIDFASTTNTDGRASATIKVAKSDAEGAPEQLDEDELSAARGFANKLQGAGLLLTLVSFPGDKLKIDLDLFYNGDGVETVVREQVVSAINEYLEQALTFDGKIKILTLIDYIQNKVETLDDLEITYASITPDGGNELEFSRSIDTKSGYAIFDEDNSNINLTVV